jgi:hypothetical protein
VLIVCSCCHAVSEGVVVIDAAVIVGSYSPPPPPPLPPHKFIPDFSKPGFEIEFGGLVINVTAEAVTQLE